MLQTNALEICGEAWFFDRLLLLLPAFQIGCMSVLSPVLSVVRILTGNSLTALESSLLFALFVCSIVRSFGFLYANLRYSSQFVLFLFFFLLNLRVICAKMLRITRMHFNHLFQRWDGLEPISIAHEKTHICADLHGPCIHNAVNLKLIASRDKLSGVNFLSQR